MTDLTRPIIGIENRTAQEVFDIMCDRFRSLTAAGVKPRWWTKVTDEMDHKTLKSINIDNQVLAYERGRYFNAWLEFDEYEGGWIWRDEADSEPSPSHYCALPTSPALTTEGE